MAKEIKHPLVHREVLFPEEETVRDEDELIDVGAMAGAGCNGTGKMPTANFEPKTVFVLKDGKIIGVRRK